MNNLIRTYNSILECGKGGNCKTYDVNENIVLNIFQVSLINIVVKFQSNNQS